MTPEEKTKRILKLEGELARCQNELYAAEREIARLKQVARRKKTKKSRKVKSRV